LAEVRTALIEADVALAVVKDFIDKVRPRAIGENVIRSVQPGQQVIKIVHDVLVETLGQENAALNIGSPPAPILMVGLQGSGKTTSAAKLARHITRQGRRPLLVAADPYRPAAADQLQALGKQIDIPVYRAPNGTTVPDIARGAITAAKTQARDVLILDTAGRTSLDEEMLDEIRVLGRQMQPAETLLVVDAMVGQEAVAVARAFVDACPVTGIVLTKIDGDARGGAALSISAMTGLPVKFLGTGERTDALEPFHPDRLAGRILGMGDVLTLIERAQENVDEKQAEDLARKLQRNTFTLEDFLSQMQQLKKMGPIGGLLELIPGMGGAAKEAQKAVDSGELKRVEAIIQSMTLDERRDPNILTASRRRRIARGSGTTLQDVNRLVKQFGEMRKLMKQFGGSAGRRQVLPFGRR